MNTGQKIIHTGIALIIMFSARSQSDLVESLDPFIMYAQPGYSTSDGLKHNEHSYLTHHDFGKLTFNAPYGKNVVEVISKRTVDERYYVDLNDQTFFYIEKSNRPMLRRFIGF